MAKHLTENDVENLLGILDGWQGELSWNSFVEACPPIVHTRPTRQTLYRIERIHRAFCATKARLSNPVPETSVPPTLVAARQALQRLRAENHRLRLENGNLHRQFVKWQYNAFDRGLTEQMLNRPLPPVDLGRTDEYG